MGTLNWNQRHGELSCSKYHSLFLALNATKSSAHQNTHSPSQPQGETIINITSLLLEKWKSKLFPKGCMFVFNYWAIFFITNFYHLTPRLVGAWKSFRIAQWLTLVLIKLRQIYNYVLTLYETDAVCVRQECQDAFVVLWVSGQIRVLSWFMCSGVFTESFVIQYYTNIYMSCHPNNSFNRSL